MQRLTFIVFALVAAVALAGCSSTGSGAPDPDPMPEPEPFPDSVDEALANGIEGATVYFDDEAGMVAPGTATLHLDVDGDTFVFEADGTTLTLTGAGPDGTFSEPAWDKPASYETFAFNGAAMGDGDSEGFVGQYMAIVHVERPIDDPTSPIPFPYTDEYYAHFGLDTPLDALPAQTADYEGAWGIAGGVPDGNGIFDASADFDAGTIAFDITADDGTTAMGGGSGTISGSAFSSSFDLTGAQASVNTVTGNFYGPGAEEMAGVIAGASGGFATYGYVFGHQK